MNQKVEQQEEIDEEEQQYLEELAREDEGIDAPAPIEPEQSEADEQDSEAENKEEPEQQPEVPAFDPVAEIQKLRTALERTNGTYGNQLQIIRSQLEALNKAPKPADKNEAVEVKGKIEVTPNSLSKLKSEFPELAELLAQDLSELLAASQPDSTGTIDPRLDELEQKLQAERGAREQQIKQFQMRMLSRDHPDWREIATYTPDQNGLVKWKNPAFGNWVAAQPESVQNTILNGDDAYEIAGHLTAFKKTLKQKQQSNLTKAVQPKGTVGSRAVSALDEEERLFREELEREEY